MTIFNNINFLSAAMIILSVLTIALLCLVIWMYMKMRRFLVGADSNNISDSLAHVADNLKDLQKFKTDMEDYLTNVESRLRKSIQSVETIRFNPFQGTGAGGNQSFATAFLNESGDGVVISSLYSRDRVSVFSKPIKNLASEHEMSDEEKEVLSKAKQGLHKK